MSVTLEADAIVDVLGIAQCLFFGICVFAAMKRNPANVFLAALMFAFAIYYLDGVIDDIGVPEPLSDVLWPADFLLPPLIYLYVVDLVSPEPKTAGLRRLLHFFPFGISILLLMPYFTLPETLLDARLEWGEGSWEPREGEGESLSADTAPFQLIAAFSGIILFSHLSLLQVTAYIFTIILIYWRYRRRIKDIYSNIEAMKLSWLGFVAGFVFFIWIIVVPMDLLDLNGLIDISDELELAVAAAQLLVIYTLGIVGLRQPVVFDVHGVQALAELSEVASQRSVSAEDGASEDGTRDESRRKYARSPLSDDDAARIAAKLEAYMAENRLFLDSDLTLPKLAEQMGISVNYISQAMNQHLGQNFFDFVNSRRIEEAKTLLATTDDSVLDIALIVGFNAKSTFNAAFRKIIGITPSQFRSASRREQNHPSPTAKS